MHNIVVVVKTPAPHTYVTYPLSQPLLRNTQLFLTPSSSFPPQAFGEGWKYTTLTGSLMRSLRISPARCTAGHHMSPVCLSRTVHDTHFCMLNTLHKLCNIPVHMHAKSEADSDIFDRDRFKIPDVHRDTYVTRVTATLNLAPTRAKPTRICMSYYSHFDDFSNNPEGNPTIARKVAS